MPAMRAGSYVDGELWLRCPFCGDSEQHKRKAHFSVATNGVYYCFRCGKGGKLPMSKLVYLYSRADVLDVVLRDDKELEPEDFKAIYKDLMPGPAVSRGSALDRFKLGTRDVFLSRKPSGELIGLAIVDGRKRGMIGSRGFGFAGHELLSSPEDPIRLVEGPYDTLTDRDVCVYGAISSKHLQQLKGHCVILCPDGDVWSEERKRKTFLRCLNKSMYSRFGASVAWVEKLMDDQDPDEVAYKDRLVLSPSYVLSNYG